MCWENLNFEVLMITSSKESKMIYKWILFNCNPDKQFFCITSEVAKELNISSMTVKRYIKKLLDYGYIKPIGSKRYQLNENTSTL